MAPKDNAIALEITQAPALVAKTEAVPIDHLRTDREDQRAVFRRFARQFGAAIREGALCRGHSSVPSSCGFIRGSIAANDRRLDAVRAATRGPVASPDPTSVGAAPGDPTRRVGSPRAPAIEA